jgi:hypothetical protein
MATAIGVCSGAGEYLVTIFGTLMLSVVALIMYGPASDKNKQVSDEVRDEAAPASSVEAAPAGTSRWGVDFVAVKAAGGARTRVLIIVDEESREALTLTHDSAFTGARLVEALQTLAIKRGMPAVILSDTWPECHAPAVLEWRKANRVDWRYVSLDASVEPAPFVGNFSGQLQRECLDGVGNKSQPLHERLAQWQTAYNKRLVQRAPDARLIATLPTESRAILAPVADKNVQVYLGERKRRRH